ncbi:Unknown protein sequence [Pseudomonas amygdali pv. lachrymans]|uniref:Uncharacterized protein n=1 Tax=Pseudomonas amygdali pv. lachrymans TaxID=53707 RepID=A0ABR5KZX7_PSEAV|nr:Unknown protein sequence [Pseudomonas amygdali pv. lachrymans]KPC20996.1 Unknown protein sequence [Pseudomonas amygdali pv. lachrymans]
MSRGPCQPDAGLSVARALQLTVVPMLQRIGTQFQNCQT